MEPDETLITKMLMWARDIEPGRRRSPTPTDFPNYSEDEIRFHAVLLDQQGWLDKTPENVANAQVIREGCAGLGWLP